MNMKKHNLRTANVPMAKKEAKDSPILSNVKARESYQTGTNTPSEYVNASSGVSGPYGAKGKN